MKHQTGIWIDGSKAYIIDLVDNMETIREIASNIENKVHHANEGDKGSFMGSHHLNNDRKFQERKKHQTDQFLDKVIQEVRNADELLIMGPAGLKTKLKNRLQKDRLMAPKLKAVMPADYITLNQCVARVRAFYEQPVTAVEVE